MRRVGFAQSAAVGDLLAQTSDEAVRDRGFKASRTKRVAPLPVAQLPEQLTRPDRVVRVAPADLDHLLREGARLGQESVSLEHVDGASELGQDLLRVATLAREVNRSSFRTRPACLCWITSWLNLRRPFRLR